MAINGEAAALNGSLLPTPHQVREKYELERNKRLRKDGSSQFVDLYSLERFRRFVEDPWIDPNVNAADIPSPVDGSHHEILILGAGYAGLLYAARLIDAGFSPDDIRMVDSAGGFGGTWYWNRYPGLMCDIESYIYMPLLEETGYIPTKKYTSGNELREHAERIAKKWNLTDKAWFRTNVRNVSYDEEQQDWIVNLERGQGANGEKSHIQVRSRFVFLTTGFTVIPHIPQLPGIETFNGECFHTARWDYEITGGAYQDPSLTNLKDKKVGIIGTGATAIQVVPAVAQWAKELYIFQRTPSAVDSRDNSDTDLEWWQREVANKRGWQSARRENFNQFISNINPKPEVNLVNDSWTIMPAYSALVGTPDATKHASVKKYIDYLHEIDLPRQERIRKRVDEIIKDPTTAEKLKPWYPSWCKRPCFHDEYLQAFNRPNVTLIDTDGNGVTGISEKNILVGDKSYELDVLILSTGYRSPSIPSPPGRVDVSVTGRGGLSFDHKWKDGVTTLHGTMSHDFPNFFWPGFSQAGGTPNFMFCIDFSATHVADILRHALGKQQPMPSGSLPYKYNFTVEPTVEAEEQWARQVVAQASALAGAQGCTPNYFNGEGDLDQPAPNDVLEKRARAALWGNGVSHFMDVMRAWRSAGDYNGVEILPTAQ